MIIVSIFALSLLSLLLLWLLFGYTHNQCNYQNNYQIINHSFKVHLLAEHSTFTLLIFVVVPVVVVVVVWIINQYFHQ